MRGTKSENEDFNQLFRKFWNKVYQLCLRYCQNEDVAKDLTQNIFTSIWQRKVHFPDSASAERYLAKAAKYQCIQYWRSQQNDRKVPPVEAFTCTPEQLFLDRELADRTALILHSLPEPSRTIFHLNREQALTYQQIAHLQNISIKTVEFHISRALKVFRKLLEN
ncbi:hypothetical protein GCM10027347_54740 [Larkinella harenae]